MEFFHLFLVRHVVPCHITSILHTIARSRCVRFGLLHSFFSVVSSVCAVLYALALCNHELRSRHLPFFSLTLRLVLGKSTSSIKQHLKSGIVRQLMWLLDSCVHAGEHVESCGHHWPSPSRQRRKLTCWHEMLLGGVFGILCSVDTVIDFFFFCFYRCSPGSGWGLAAAMWWCEYVTRLL